MDALKVVIVDDEPLVRDLLKNCIDWDRIGFRIIGEAASAKEVFEMVEQEIPDIVLTDICMPFMDGIELSKALIEKYPQLKVVIITGYEEFDYAQRSIKAGVTDYILKPINDEEITRVVLNLKSKILAEKLMVNEYQQLKKQLEASLPFLREKFLNELIFSPVDPLEMERKLQFYQLEMKTPDFQIAVVEIIDENRKYHEEERLLSNIYCQKLIKEHYQAAPYLTVFFDNHQRVVLLNNQAEENDAFYDKIKEILLNQLNASFCIGVGNRRQGIANIRLSYKEASNALKSRVLLGNNEIIFYRELDFSETLETTATDERIDVFGFYLKAGMKEQLFEALASIFGELPARVNLSIDQIRIVASKIILTILNVITEYKINMADLFGKGLHPYDQIFKIDNFPEMKRYLNEVVNQAVMLIHQLQHRKMSKVVQEVRDYLIKNFQDPDLSLANVALAFYLNPSYLSRIFKQETNQTFVECLTQIRMEKAIKFFKETDLKAYQIAEKVGISDPHYFGLCFKKYTGMSVNDYKRNLGW